MIREFYQCVKVADDCLRSDGDRVAQRLELLRAEGNQVRLMETGGDDWTTLVCLEYRPSPQPVA